MALANGIYRIAFSPTNTLLTLDKWATTGDIQYVTGRADDQDPTGSAAQQWVVTLIPESQTYTILNVVYGLYLTPIYQDDANTYITGAARPFHWRIDTEPGNSTYSLTVKPTNRMLTLSGYSATPGTRAQTYPRTASSVAQRSWIFRVVQNAAAVQPAKPIVTLPPIKPGVYRIRNTGARTLLTQRTTVDTNQTYPRVVGLAYASDNDYQVWEVSLYTPSQTYFIKNRGSGKFLHTFDYSDHGYDFAGLSETEGGKCHWDIRQGEYEGQFVIQIPGLSWTVDLDGGNPAPNTRIYTYHRFNQPNANHQTWWFDPIDQLASAITRRPTTIYMAPLKTGTYYIRNTASRTLLTQAQDIAIQAEYKDPVVVGSPFQSDSKFQLWTLEYLPDVQLYTVQNVGSGRYLSSIYGSIDGSVITASEVKRPWSIKQSEASPEFTFHIVGSQLLVWLYAGLTTANTAVWLQNKAGQPTVPAQRWLFEPADGTDVNLVNPNPTDSDNTSTTAWNGQAFDPNFVPAFFLTNLATSTVANVGGKDNQWFTETTDAAKSLFYLKTVAGDGGYLGINGQPQVSLPIIIVGTGSKVAWQIRPDPTDTTLVKIYYPGTNFLLDLTAANPADGTPITLNSMQVPGTNQTWKVVPAE